MKKNEDNVTRRANMVKATMNDANQAADILEDYAAKLRATRGTTDRIQILSDLLCISESTLYRDVSKL